MSEYTDIVEPLTWTKGTEGAILSLTEQALVWSARTWVIHYHRGSDPYPAIDPVFRLLNAPAVPVALNRFLAMLSVHAVRPIEIRCTKHAGVSRDEIRLLVAIGSAQHARPLSQTSLVVERTIATWFDKVGSCSGRDTLFDLAYQLTAAGIDIPLRSYEPTAAPPNPALSQEHVTLSRRMPKR